MKSKKDILLQIANDIEDMEKSIEEATKPFRAVIADQRATITRLQRELDQAKLGFAVKHLDEIINCWGEKCSE